MVALKYWSGTAWTTISNTAGPPGPAGPGGYSLAEEFKPAASATTVTVAQVPQFILLVSRDGMIQSATDGHYSLLGQVLTFTDSFNGTERVVVEYAIQGTPPVTPFNGAGISDGTVSLAKLAANSVDTSKIVDGTIATADLANASVTNAKLASDTARANLLTNGGFEQWQRGAGPFTSYLAYSADRWRLVHGGTDVLSVTRDTANVDVGSQYCAAIAFTLNPSGGSIFQTQLNDSPQLRGRTVSLSIRVKTSVANGVRGDIAYNGTGAATILTPFHSGGSVYQTLTATATIPSDATSISVDLVLYVSGTYYVDNAMLVIGSVPTDYLPLHPADELARCQRYYETLHDGNGGYLLLGQAASATTGYAIWTYRVLKATSPTVTIVGSWQMLNAGGGANNPATVGVVGANRPNVFLQLTGSAGLVAGNATMISPTSAAGNLVCEANP